MPRLLLSLTTVLLAVIPAAFSHSQALPAADPPASLETPQQKAALIAFRTHAEELCRVLYLRPDAALTCVQRVLDAALPLDLEPVVTQTPSGARPIESRGSTVAPDGRE
jgi:hypothetical protein